LDNADIIKKLATQIRNAIIKMEYDEFMNFLTPISCYVILMVAVVMQVIFLPNFFVIMILNANMYGEWEENNDMHG